MWIFGGTDAAEKLCNSMFSFDFSMSFVCLFPDDCAEIANAYSDSD
jgi:hypothetical protein